MVGNLPLGPLTERVQSLTPPFWQRLSTAQKAIIGAAVAAGLAVVAGLVVWSQQTPYQQLYTGLNEKDAAAIAAKLKENRVPYELRDGGTTILVPQSQVHEARLQMAAQGLPTSGQVGFEVFDKNIFGMPEFVQRLNHQRALEGELARTISQLAGVESARVHLVLPKEALFTEAQRAATASVVIKLKPNARLSAQQVSAVRHLVATSVEGLQPKNITIADGEGRLLEDAAQPDASTAQLDAKRAYERNVEQAVVSMLEQTLGPSKASVRVSALMNWDSSEINKEIFTPVGTSPQPRSVRELQEAFRGEGAPPEGGTPGATTNVPPTYFATGAQGPSEYNRRDVTTNYDLSKVVEKTIPAPGTVQRLSVAVLVPEDFAPRAAQIRSLVEAAAGIVPARGDLVSVEPLPLDTSRAEQEAQNLRDEQLFQLIRTAVLTLGGLIALALIIFGLGRTIGAARPQQPPAGPMVWEAAPPPPPALPAEAPTAAPPEPPPEAVGPPAAPEAEAPPQLPMPDEELQARLEEERKRLEAEEQAEEERMAQERRQAQAQSLQELAQSDPDKIAEVLQIWLTEDRRGR